jgi:ParB family chromosome partitioning protein
MSARRSALGRGLGALIPNAGTAAGTSAEKTAGTPASPATRSRVPGAEARETTDSTPPGAPAQIPVDRIDPNAEQPRRTFDPDQLASLAESIRQHGVLQPVVVRRAGDRYELIVGERRWRASKAAGMETIPAVIADIEDRQRLELAIIENVQRNDLNPIELAHAYRALSESGATQEDIGRRVSLDRSSVANHLRLLELTRDLQEDVEVGRLTMGHAKALLQVTNPERRRHLRDRVVTEGLSVREAERLGRAIAGPAPGRKAKKPKGPLDPHLAGMLDSLEQLLQTRVRVKGDLDKGRIEIEYFQRSDLERISRILLEGQ